MDWLIIGVVLYLILHSGSPQAASASILTANPTLISPGAPVPILAGLTTPPSTESEAEPGDAAGTDNSLISPAKPTAIWSLSADPLSGTGRIMNSLMNSGNFVVRPTAISTQLND